MKATAVTLYGIPNCDTVKKARQWLTDRGIEHQFHDFKKQGLDRSLLDAWLPQASWEKLLNRKGTMWRRMDESAQAGVVDGASAAQLMMEFPSLVKRPVVDWGGKITVGFDPAQWELLTK